MTLTQQRDHLNQSISQLEHTVDRYLRLTMNIISFKIQRVDNVCARVDLLANELIHDIGYVAGHCIDQVEHSVGISALYPAPENTKYHYQGIDPYRYWLCLTKPPLETLQAQHSIMGELGIPVDKNGLPCRLQNAENIDIYHMTERPDSLDKTERVNFAALEEFGYLFFVDNTKNDLQYAPFRQLRSLYSPTLLNQLFNRYEKHSSIPHPEASQVPESEGKHQYK